MAARYRIYIRDANYQRVDELVDWLNLSLVLRFNATGTWALDVAANSVSASLLTNLSGIIVTRDGATIFSGSAVTDITRTERTLSLAGVDDNVFLEEPARPTPSQASGPYPDDYDVRTGMASSIIRSYVGVNIGPSAPVGCKIDALALQGDPSLGGTVTGRANFQSLQALLRGLAVTPAAGGLGFKILQSDTVAGQLFFSIFQPVDRTADAKFGTRLGTASDYEDVTQYPNVNYWVVMGGDGFGANRTIAEGGDAAAIAAAGRRITGVYDARGITDTAELNQKLAELLAGAITVQKTTIEPFEVPSLEFGTDWDFGDLVTVVIGGVERAEVVREVEIQLTNDRGAIITPMIGDAASTNDDTISQHLKTVRDRLTNIELNWRVPDESIIRDMLVPVLKPPIGQVIALAGSSVPAGWLACDGASYLRSTYPDLFAEISTTWGAVDGTHFTVPDLRGRVVLGVSGSHALGTTGGAESVSGPAHTHPGSHSHGLSNHTHAGQTHTHPGSHSHGMNAHRHQMGHDHDVDIGTFSSGLRNNDSVGAGGFDEPNLSSGTEDHHHNVNPPSTTTSNSNNTVTGDGEFTSGGGAFSSTQGDSNAPSASYSGSPGAPSPNSSDGDSNAPAASYSGSIATMMPFGSLRYVIYAGV
jgi:microcystin-dependent protein